MTKMLMQQIWIDKTEWDDKLSFASLEKWVSFLEDFSNITNIQIPRWVLFSPDSEVQFHGFCDASEKAYAAALYIRIVHDDVVYIHLLAAKSKVAPVKTLS